MLQVEHKRQRLRPSASSSPILPTVQVTNAGSGYAAPIVSFTGGGGTGAAGYATISSSALTSTASVTNGGSGYTAPTAVFSTNPGNPGTGAAATVSHFTVGLSSMASGLIDHWFSTPASYGCYYSPHLQVASAHATADAIFDPNWRDNRLHDDRCGLRLYVCTDRHDHG